MNAVMTCILVSQSLDEHLHS